MFRLTKIFQFWKHGWACYKKPWRIENAAKSLETEADQLALKAENTGKLLLVANSLHRTAKEKMAETTQLKVKLESKLQELIKICLKNELDHLTIYIIN